MDAHARAGIDIHGAVLRYAEIEQYGARYRLLRLGSCDFDFDLSEALLTGEPDYTATAAEALADIFDGSVASTLQVALHPPGCYSFFTPLPASASSAARKVRLQQEAALLAGVETPLHLTADGLRSETTGAGETVDWIHVLAVREAVQRRFARLAESVPCPRHRLMLSMHAAAVTAGRLVAPEGDGDAAPLVLALGWYPSHVEYTLCRGETWQYSQYAEAGAPGDAAYFAVDVLRRLHLRPGQVDRLFVYGPAIDPAADPFLEFLFPTPAERLNPLQVVDLDPESLTEEFDAAAYVPCIGAAL